MTRPIKQFRCRYCGERDPYKFTGELKSICGACRAQREQERYRRNVQADALRLAPREMPEITDVALRVLHDFPRVR